MLNINNTLESYLQNVEIKGNTIQNPNDLSDIKSVGDKVGDEELYRIPIVCCGKNLFNKTLGDYNSGVDFGETKKVSFKVKPNTQYTCSTNCPKPEGTSMVFFNGGGSNTSGVWINQSRTVTSDNLGNVFIAIRNKGYVNDSKLEDFFNGKYYIQLEEGTQATQYEPYKEHKITILSPCQIEKVEDMADRIIEKDGVWGVEKNIISLNHKNDTFQEVAEHGGLKLFMISSFESKYNLIPSTSQITTKITTISNLFKSYDSIGATSFLEEGLALHENGNLYIKIESTKANTVEKLVKYLNDNNFYIKCITTKPQFIPLPNNQQIKLRTFANKTNISFLTEIEGTIKADVAKSINASVKSNTKEIGKINNRILDLEGLKESQEMEYSTDKGYLVCKETKAGTVKDLKVKGKSLLNKIGKFNSLRWVNNESGTIVYYDEVIPTSTLEVGKTYTLIAYGFGKAVDPTRCVITDMNKSSMIYGNDYIFKFTVNSFTNPGIIHFYNGIGDPITEADYVNAKILLLEGDHTQSPPNGYFEGIASVGTGVDKIEVSSYTTTILNEQSIDEDWGLGSFEGGASGQVYNSSKAVNIEGIKFLYPYALYNNKITSCKFISFYDKNRELIGSRVNNYYNSSLHLKIEVPNNAVYVRLMSDTGVGQYVNTRYIATIKPINNISEIVDIKSDKKPLLYFDTTTNTWKPINELRGLDTVCDTIELHSDGKYYYHIRTEKTILNGTENIELVHTNENTLRFRFANKINANVNVNQLGWRLCDKFEEMKWIESIYTNLDKEYFSCTNSYQPEINIFKSKLSTQDVEGFKKWLQSNNVPVIYQLAEEKVFEVNPLFLESYENETMILCESGAVKPGMEWKITSYITNLVSTNTKRIKRIENDFYNYTVSQNRMMLSSRYNADRADFRIDNTLGVPKTVSVELDYDLFELMKKVVIVGKDNYDRSKIEEQMDFYVTEGFIDWDMWDELFAIIELQHNPPVDLIPIEPISIEEPKPKKSRRGRKKKLEEI